MKKLLTLILVLPLLTKAQDAVLNVMGTAGNLYLNHTAAAKESFYSVGRMYNISPKEIAPFNNITLEKGLTIGQTLKIPLKEVNFTQTNVVAQDEVAVPVYHKVEAKENLYQISTRFTKVPLASLKSWNNLSNESVSVGQNVIIGYLKVKKDLSALASKSTSIAETDEAPAKVAVKTTVKTPVKEAEIIEDNTTASNEIEEAKKAVAAAAKKLEDAVKKEKAAKALIEKANAEKIAKEEAAAEKEAAEKLAREEAAEKAETEKAAKLEAAKMAAKAAAEKKLAEKTVKETPKPKAPVVAKKEPVAVIEQDENLSNAKDFKGGVFKADFNSEGELDNGNAGIFKSTSGWEDGKYYCLYNKAQQHTIVKITNKTTGKFIYAKVLDVMPDLKQNANVIVRVSNAAAEVLGAGTSSFDCKIEY